MLGAKKLLSNYTTIIIAIRGLGMIFNIQISIHIRLFRALYSAINTLLTYKEEKNANISYPTIGCENRLSSGVIDLHKIFQHFNETNIRLEVIKILHNTNDYGYCIVITNE